MLFLQRIEFSFQYPVWKALSFLGLHLLRYASTLASMGACTHTYTYTLISKNKINLRKTKNFIIYDTES